MPRLVVVPDRLSMRLLPRHDSYRHLARLPLHNVRTRTGTAGQARQWHPQKKPRTAVTPIRACPRASAPKCPVNRHAPPRSIICQNESIASVSPKEIRTLALRRWRRATHSRFAGPFILSRARESTRHASHHGDQPRGSCSPHQTPFRDSPDTAARTSLRRPGVAACR